MGGLPLENINNFYKEFFTRYDNNTDITNEEERIKESLKKLKTKFNKAIKIPFMHIEITDLKDSLIVEQLGLFNDSIISLNSLHRFLKLPYQKRKSILEASEKLKK